MKRTKKTEEAAVIIKHNEINKRNKKGKYVKNRNKNKHVNHFISALLFEFCL